MKREPVEITRNSDDKLVKAFLIEDVTTIQIRNVIVDWSRFMATNLQNVRAEEAPRYPRWDWEMIHKKRSLSPAYAFYGVECEGEMQGLMLLNTILRPSKIAAQKRKQIIYGVNLATAPWNFEGFGSEPRFSHVGSILLAATIKRSRQEGSEGRFGLHSLIDSEGFYRRCKLRDLGIDEGHEERLRYFEMTKRNANIFLPRDR